MIFSKNKFSSARSLSHRDKIYSKFNNGKIRKITQISYLKRTVVSVDKKLKLTHIFCTMESSSYKITILTVLLLILITLCRIDRKQAAEELSLELTDWTKQVRNNGPSGGLPVAEPQPSSQLSGSSQLQPQFSQVQIQAQQPIFYATYQPPFNIYFYPKMGKCGSTTMHKVLKQLAILNNFEIMHIEADGIQDSTTDLNLNPVLAKNILNYSQNMVAQNVNKNLVVVKHHRTVNFTEFNMKVHSFNLVRHPVSRWISAYNFCRGGMSRRPAVQKACEGFSQEVLQMSIEDSILKFDPWVTERYKSYFSWLETDECHFTSFEDQNWLNNKDPQKGYEIMQLKQATINCIKVKISRLYITIGILEDYDLTMSLFEKAVPEVFKGALDVFRGKGTFAAIKNSKTVRQDGVRNETFEYLCEKPFKYEVDLYDFIVKRFYEQAKVLGLR